MIKAIPRPLKDPTKRLSFRFQVWRAIEHAGPNGLTIPELTGIIDPFYVSTIVRGLENDAIIERANFTRKNDPVWVRTNFKKGIGYA